MHIGNKIMNVEKTKMIRDAIKSSDLEKIRGVFSENPAFLNEQTAFGTWLHDAATLGKLEIVMLLVDLGIDINIEAKAEHIEGNALDQAVSFEHIDIADYLISKGIKLDVSEPTKNPLFGAITVGNKEIVKLLINAGIDISVRYTGKRMHNMDALTYAEERGELEIAELIRAALATQKQ
jgi:uncharacterized protein